VQFGQQHLREQAVICLLGLFGCNRRFIKRDGCCEIEFTEDHLCQPLRECGLKGRI